MSLDERDPRGPVRAAPDDVAREIVAVLADRGLPLSASCPSTMSISLAIASVANRRGPYGAATGGNSVATLARTLAIARDEGGDARDAQRRLQEAKRPFGKLREFSRGVTPEVTPLPCRPKKLHSAQPPFGKAESEAHVTSTSLRSSGQARVSRLRSVSRQTAGPATLD
jgi:hypothetical protein